jgi:hypothetical protein
MKELNVGLINMDFENVTQGLVGWNMEYHHWLVGTLPFNWSVMIWAVWITRMMIMILIMDVRLMVDSVMPGFPPEILVGIAPFPIPWSFPNSQSLNKFQPQEQSQRTRTTTIRTTTATMTSQSPCHPCCVMIRQ